MKIYLSRSTDPAVNLATEAFLRAETTQDHFLVYRNDPCVMVGRNQCVEAEADTVFCREKGIAILRRISGGGTVYHDHGNINYSFIGTGSSLLDAGRENLDIITALLETLGVRAVAGPRKELLIDGKKISGTASFCRGGRFIFHGTLLYDADLVTLGRALRGNLSKQGRKTASVPSATINIKDTGTKWKGISALEFATRLTDAAAAHWNSPALSPYFEAGILESYYPEIIYSPR